jgi:serine/threonine protein kinase/tetratricopeptide (TPR) repeat protein
MITAPMERRDPDGTAADAFAQTVAPDTLPAPDAGAESGQRPPASAPPTAPPAATGVAGSIAARSMGAKLDGRTLDHPSKDRIVTSDAELATLPEVDLDHYVAEAEVARGGMGRIVAARDRRLGRPVAIKELIGAGGEAAIRFRREALITARLQHPGIVPVYEAGRWPSGEPFFAMKLVAGRPLDKVIAEARTLPDRLALLPRIAAATDAIAYAHSQRGIHRDLKPGNILIGDFGETVVIDWGLAKDLDAVDIDDSASGATRTATRAPITPRIRPPGTATGTGAGMPASRPRDPTTERERAAAAHSDGVVTRPHDRDGDSSTLTVVGSVMGTPAYMAPEQARGEAVDARADVFSLGAMLYHVLAGVPPYDARTATDVLAAAALGKIVPLEQRAPRVPADLLAIVGRAMAGDPAARYATAGELAEELRRFLTGQLVGAHRYTAWQRVTRFVRRHRAAVAIATVAVAGFAVGGTIAVRRIVEARDRAEVQRQLAIKHRQAAERLVDFMQTDLTQRLEPMGRLDLMVPLGTEVKRYFEDLAEAPGGMRAEDIDRMARALRAIAYADDKSGNTDAAIASWNEVKDRLTKLLAVAPDASGAFDRQLILAQTQIDLGRAIYARGQIDESAALYAGAAHALAALLKAQPNHRETLLAAGNAHDLLGDLLRNHGKVDESVDEYTAARQLREQLASGHPDDRDAIHALSTSHFKLGAVHYARGETAEGLTEYRASARLRDELGEMDPDNPTWQLGRVQVNTQIADLQREIGELAAAIATYEATLPIADGLLKRDATNTEWRRFRGNLLSDFGFTLVDAGDYTEALARFEQARANHAELVTRDPENASWQVDMSRILTRTGDAQLALGDYAAAQTVLEQARAIRKALVARNPKNDVWKRLLAWSSVKLAQLYSMRKATGDAQRTLAVQEEALALRTELVVSAPSNAGLKNELASSTINLARALMQAAAGPPPPRVGALLDQGVALAQALVDGDPVNTEWKETLVSGLYNRGLAGNAARDWAAARPAFEAALRLAEGVVARSPDSSYWRGTLAEILESLALTDVAEGKPEDAALHRRAAYAELQPLVLAGRLPAYRKPLYKRLEAHQ